MHEAIKPEADDVERREELCHVARQLENLPQETVEVLALKVLDGMSYREIAQITGYSLGKISRIVNSGVKSLASSLPHSTGKER